MDDPAAQPPRRPTLATALLYEEGSAPRVVATGRGHVADRILETAARNGVRIEENPVLAEALSHVELGDHIPVELYQAVAVVISAVLRAGDTLRRTRGG